jgi:phosphoribosylformylglycinamidine (FGAM) synthase-like amidotransferase family enzyme
MALRIGVVLFPGTNCEHDAIQALERLGATAELVWHGATSAAGYDALILPGGFAHGDYLRPVLAGHGHGVRLRGKRWPGHRDLQRFPGADRG